jgi:hypothetical protein
MFTPRYSSNTAKVGVKHQSYMFTPGYSSNTAKIGVKHHSINHLKKILIQLNTLNRTFQL